MRIECPGCNATYEVPETQIRPGRSVRCVRCDVQWRPAGELVVEPVAAASRFEVLHDDPLHAPAVRLRQSAAPAAPVDDPTVAVAPAVRVSIPWRLRKPVWKRRGWGIGWAASLILLGGLLATAAHWRSAIMQDWPPSVRLYTALGAQPPRS